MSLDVRVTLGSTPLWIDRLREFHHEWIQVNESAMSSIIKEIVICKLDASHLLPSDLTCSWSLPVEGQPFRKVAFLICDSGLSTGCWSMGEAGPANAL